MLVHILSIYLSIFVLILNAAALLVFKNVSSIIGVLSAIACLIFNIKLYQKENKRRKQTQKYWEDVQLMVSCKYYSGERLMKCAVNPSSSCNLCAEYAPKK